MITVPSASVPLFALAESSTDVFTLKVALGPAAGARRLPEPRALPTAILIPNVPTPDGVTTTLAELAVTFVTVAMPEAVPVVLKLIWLGFKLNNETFE